MNLPASLPNPFRSSVTADPWKMPEADVPNIHGNVFRDCCLALAQVRATGSSTGLLIHGQAGSGKTHLLARLREHLADRPPPYPDLNQSRQVFASVRLATTPRRIWRHVRQRFVDDLLLRRLPERLSQLEHLLATRLAELGEGAGDLGRWWEYKREADPGHLDELLYDLSVEAQADDRLMNVLGQFARGAQKRNARSWLRGDPLSEGALEQLGLAPAPSEACDPEDEARSVVVSLCRLAGPRIPVVFCFDQVEALDLSDDGHQGLAAFAKLIAELHDQCGNTVLISCIQTDFLPTIKSSVPEYAYGRITSYGNRALAPLRLEEALELVATRLEFAPGLAALRQGAPDRIWPLTTDEVRKRVGGGNGCTPRELLSFCADRFADLQHAAVGAPPTDDEFLECDWRRRFEAAMASNTPDQTEEILTDAFPLLVQIVGQGARLGVDDALRDVDFTLTDPQTQARVGVSLCTQPNMNALTSRLRRLRESLEQGKLQKLVLLRDSRTPISEGAKKAREHLDELRKQPAVFCRPPVQALAALDALRSLLADAQSGDLATGGRTIGVGSVRDWLAQHLTEPLRELANHLVTPPLDSCATRAEVDEDLERGLDVLESDHVGELNGAEAGAELDGTAEERLQA
jgi:hypothetical protein